MISLLLIVANAQKSPPPADFPFPTVLYCPEGVVDFQVAVVRDAKRLGYEEREFRSQESSCKVTVALDEVTIVDSTTKLAKKSVIVTPFRASGGGTQFQNRSDVLRKLNTGSNHLVFYAVPKDNSHILPVEGFWNSGATVPASYRYAMISMNASKGEILALGAYETKSTIVVEKDASPIDRLMLNVAETLRESNLEGVQSACSTLRLATHGRYFYSGTLGDRRLATVPSDSPCVKRLRELASALSPSNRARVAMVLFIWNVKGGSFDLVDALRVAGNDPNLFNMAGDTYIRSRLFEPGAIARDARNEQEIEKKGQEFFEFAIETKSPGLRWLLMNNCIWAPTNAGQRRALAAAAAATDEEAELLFTLLAQWNQDSENLPKFELAGSNRVFVNRKGLIEHWKNVLGI